jgi:hypothetical protein
MATKPKHATHVALASVSARSYNYKLHKDSVEVAKRSQKLLCSPAVDLIPLRMGRHEAPAAIQTGALIHRQVGRNRLLSLSGRDRRHAQRRTANGGASKLGRGRCGCRARPPYAGCHGSDGKGSPLGPDLTSGHWIWVDCSLTAIAHTLLMSAYRARRSTALRCRPWAGPSCTDVVGEPLRKSRTAT